MLTTILTGVDASSTAAIAAQKAASLAQQVGAELVLVCAYGKFSSETYQSGAEKIVFSNERDARETAERLAAQLRREFEGLNVRAEPAEGKPADAIVSTAERFGADLIVVGNKRAQGIARVLGSIAGDVTARAQCDVLVAYTRPR